MHERDEAVRTRESMVAWAFDYVGRPHSAEHERRSLETALVVATALKLHHAVAELDNALSDQ